MPTMQSGASVRGDLIERVQDARRQSDALFEVVRPDALFDRPIRERHRLIFYVGHLEAFDWNLLHGSLPGLKSFHPEFDRLFAFGIDPINGGLPTDQPSDWPALENVRDYVSRIRCALDEKLEGESRDASLGGRDGFSQDTLLNVAIEHRLMHVETLAYLLHQLPLDRKIRQRTKAVPVTAPVTPRMVKIPSGVATLGLPRSPGSFGWDNEYEAHEANVPALEIDQYKITNGQFLDFVNAGGYEKQSLWRDEDWQWKSDQGISHPVFWKRADDQWLFRGMFEDLRLPLEWPAYVSHAEAAAYAKWVGKSLPTEEEWHRAAYGKSSEDSPERAYPWGNDWRSNTRPSASFGNFDFNCWNPTPVNAFPQGQSAFGVWDMLGNGWEWTSSQFAPFAGFEPFPFYRGYSADFFDGKHFVMKGGSSRTARCMLRASFRNWFQPHYQYVYAGFRCVSR
jgi:iron(II)-dependent oxidoreductase